MSLIKHTSQFTTISNHILHSKDLTWKAKGIYAYLNSKPENWAFSIERIARESNDTTYSTEQGIKELKQSGLLVQKARLVKNSKGQNILSGQEYHLYSEIKKVKESENKEPSDPITVPPNFRHTETPSHGNPATLNKTIINKTEYKKKENKQIKESIIDNQVYQKEDNLILNKITTLSLCDLIGIDKENIQGRTYSLLAKLAHFLQSKNLKQENLTEILELAKEKEKTLENMLNSMNWGGWIKTWEAKKAVQEIKQFTITQDPNYGKTPLNSTTILNSEFASEYYKITLLKSWGYKKDEILAMDGGNNYPNYSKYEFLVNELFTN
jgi:hypothetical protein